MKSIIAIIDHYPILRVGLVHFLKEQFSNTIVIEYENLSTFQQKCSYDKPDVLMIALSQHNHVNNFALIEFAKESFDLRTVIFYDQESDFSMIQHYFKIGIQYYLTKQSDLTDLKKYLAEIFNEKI